MSPGIKRILWIVVVTGFFVSCAVYPGATQEMRLPTAQHSTPPRGPTHAPSTTPSIALLPFQTSVVSPTLAATSVEFEAALIKEESLTDGGFVVTAFWSEDGSTVYYALDTGRTVMPRSPRWYAIDIHSREESRMASSPVIVYPPRFYPAHIYPQYEGFVSPSGRYRLEIVGDATGSYSDPPNAQSILWLVDTTGENPQVKLLEAAILFYREACWFPIPDFVSEFTSRP